MVTKCGLSSTFLRPRIINHLHSVHNLLSEFSSLSINSVASTYPEDALAPRDTAVGSQTGTIAKVKLQSLPISQGLLERIHPDPPNAPPTDILALCFWSTIPHISCKILPQVLPTVATGRSLLSTGSAGKVPSKAVICKFRWIKTLKSKADIVANVTVGSVRKTSFVLAGVVFYGMISETNAEAHLTLEINKSHVVFLN